MQNPSSNAPLTRPLIPLADYQRIFRVIHSVLSSVEADIPAASFFFSVTAAQILKKFYKRNAFPVAGAAFYLVDRAQGAALSFGAIADDGVISSNHDAFHAWVQCDGYAIDFMAPVFQELLAAAGHAMPVPRRMFQKNLARMSASHTALAAPGDFFLAADLALTRTMLQQFMAKKALTNLSEVCLDWYRKPPRSMPDDLALQGAEGEISRIKLIGTAVDGVW